MSRTARMRHADGGTAWMRHARHRAATSRTALWEALPTALRMPRRSSRRTGHASRGMERMSGALIALAMVVGPLTVPSAALGDDRVTPAADGRQTAQSAQTDARRAPASDVTVMAFQQSWNTVAAECTNIYGPSGVRYVQISPPSESVVGTEWWTAYQPVSYRLDSRFGTQAELASMIRSCNAAGVDVVADVELNNTTDASVSWVDDQVGVAGSRYNGTYGRYPAFTSSEEDVKDGLYRYKDNGNNHQYGVATRDFHDCATNVKHFKDVQPEEIWNCRQETRWDLNTSDAHVRAMQTDYLYRLWKLGVRGFRVSSAKFIDPKDIAALKAALVGRIGAEAAKQLRFTQEVVYHPEEIAQIQAAQYTRNGRVEEFRYAYDLLAAFSGDAERLRTLTDGYIGGDGANVFVANWNTVRGSETLTPESGARYELANAFMLADDYGEPMLLSDYHFDAGMEGLAPQGTSDTRVPDVDMRAQCATAAGTASTAWTWGSWHCQPYWTSTRGMIGFHNAVHGTTRTNWQHPSANNIGFARSGAVHGGDDAGDDNGDDNGGDEVRDRGFFALNNTLVASTVTYRTSLPDGVYCNVYMTNKRNCGGGHQILVRDGRFTTTIPARGAVAIHDGALFDADAKDDPTSDRGPVYGEETADLGRIADRRLTVYVPRSAAPEGAGRLSARITDANGAEARTVPLTAVDGRDGWLSADIDDVNTQPMRLSVVDAAGNPVLASQRGWYDVGVGATLVWVDAAGAHTGTPFATGATDQKTRLTVHVPLHALNDVQGVRVIGAGGSDGADGAGVGRYCALETVENASDRRVTCEVDGLHGRLRFRLVAGEDATAAAPGTQDEYRASTRDQVVGSIEAWIDANGALAQESPESRSPSATPQPNDQKNPQQLDVTVHYYRPDGEFQRYDLTSDVWYGWDLWTWAYETESGGMQRFTEHDGFGEIARYTLTQNEQGIRRPEFIVRQGGDAWMDKDPDDDDRLLPESAIHVSPGQSAVGTAEIWLVAGDRHIYTSEPGVVALTFDTQGGSPVAAQALGVGGVPHEPAESEGPTRDGYVFAGWSADAAGTRPFDFAAAVRAPATAYAQWTPAVTVDFAAGYTPAGGQTVTVPTPVDLARGGTLTLTQTLTREGYDFTGWRTADGRMLQVGERIAVDASMTLTAQWKAKTYRVTFDANGGGFKDGEGASGTSGASVVVEVGHGRSVQDTATPPEPVAADDGAFVGWTTTRDGDVAYDLARPVTGDLTLHAKWARPGETFHKVTLHYHDADGGTAGGDAEGTVSAVFAKDGERPTLDDPQRGGHRFLGWSTSDGGEPSRTPPVVDADLDLHARWRRVWTVTFCDTAAGAKQPCVGEDGATSDAAQVIASVVVDDGATAAQPPTSPQRDGYHLLGWSRKADGTTDNTGNRDAVIDLKTTPVTGDMQLYTVWVPSAPQWTIRFDLNGGAADPAIGDMRVYDGERLRNPTAAEAAKPTRDGYTFQGWSTVRNDALCLSVFRFDADGMSTIPIDRDGTLYAIWAPVAVRRPQQ